MYHTNTEEITTGAREKLNLQRLVECKSGDLDMIRHEISDNVDWVVSIKYVNGNLLLVYIHPHLVSTLL